MKKDCKYGTRESYGGRCPPRKCAFGERENMRCPKRPAGATRTRKIGKASFHGARHKKLPKPTMRNLLPTATFRKRVEGDKPTRTRNLK